VAQYPSSGWTSAWVSAALPPALGQRDDAMPCHPGVPTQFERGYRRARRDTQSGRLVRNPGPSLESGPRRIRCGGVTEAAARIIAVLGSNL
jgi:hypothetical protein